MIEDIVDFNLRGSILGGCLFKFVFTYYNFWKSFMFERENILLCLKEAIFCYGIVRINPRNNTIKYIWVLCNI